MGGNKAFSRQTNNANSKFNFILRVSHFDQDKYKNIKFINCMTLKKPYII